MKIQKNQIIDAEVSGIQPYGAFVKIEDGRKGLIFIELTPNLVGMTEYKKDLEYGQKVDVKIKNIQPDKKKVKLVIV